MPASEHESWRFDARSGSILGPNSQVVAVVEDRDREQVGTVFRFAFHLLEEVENYLNPETGDGLGKDVLLHAVASCRGESTDATKKRLGWRD